MHIGIAFDLKPAEPPPAGAPDDWYEEFDAPVTIHAIAEVLRGMGHTVTLMGDGAALLEALLKTPPDFVFNFAEGTGVSRSREARVPAVCEMLGIPYTGSDPLALAVALDKDLTRKIVELSGVIVPKGLVLKFDAKEYDGDYAEFPALLDHAELKLPVIAKPTCEGSSKGVRSRCLITEVNDFGPTVMQLWRDYQQPVLVEEFIDGPEVTVGIIGNDPPQVFGVMSIAPKKVHEARGGTPPHPQPVSLPARREEAEPKYFVYSVEVKRDYKRLIDYACPAKLRPRVHRAIEAAALTVFEALGCRDVARLDFRLKDNVPYFIEINPLPGLNPESSDLVIMANLLNVSHADLVTRIVTAAFVRQGLLESFAGG